MRKRNEQHLFCVHLKNIFWLLEMICKILSENAEKVLLKSLLLNLLFEVASGSQLVKTKKIKKKRKIKVKRLNEERQKWRV